MLVRHSRTFSQCGIGYICGHAESCAWNIVIRDGGGTIYRAPTIEQFGKPTVGSLPTIVRTYKAAVTRRIGREHTTTGIWQRNYYEHIIRDEKDIQNKSDYIDVNPSLWDEDDNNPRNLQIP